MQQNYNKKIELLKTAINVIPIYCIYVPLCCLSPNTMGVELQRPRSQMEL